jgi:hypothetical protein
MLSTAFSGSPHNIAKYTYISYKYKIFKPKGTNVLEEIFPSYPGKS